MRLRDMGRCSVSGEGVMSEFMEYQLKIAEVTAAQNQYNYAGAALELARVRKRLAEIDSQHAPLCNLKESTRKESYAVAFYCVVGRWPLGFKYMGTAS